ncbi:unnamed protein product [Leuciscus chuanchicus]
MSEKAREEEPQSKCKDAGLFPRLEHMVALRSDWLSPCGHGNPAMVGHATYASALHSYHPSKSDREEEMENRDPDLAGSTEHMYLSLKQVVSLQRLVYEKEKDLKEMILGRPWEGKL